MPKPRYQLRANTIGQLLDKVQEKTGHRLLAHSDSIAISKYLEVAGYQVSPHTISRIAGFFTSTTKPYLHNLNTIAQFLGYHDVFDFERQWALNDQQYLEQTLIESLALAAYEANDTSAFVQIFEQLTPMSWPHMRLIQMLGMEFRVKSKRTSDFLRVMENSAKSRYLFFHFFVDEDNKENYFLESIERIHGLKGLSQLDYAFCEEYAMNKYFEREEWGAIAKRKFNVKFKDCIQPIHRSSPHLLSRLFINFIYNKHISRGIKTSELKELLAEAMSHLSIIEHEPLRLAWLGRVMKCLLLIGAEEVLQHCSDIKEETLRVLSLDSTDYEFQSIIQFAAIKLGWINSLEIKSFKREWHNSLLQSSAWDILCLYYSKGIGEIEKEDILSKVALLAHIINNQLLIKLMKRMRNEKQNGPG